MKDLDESNVGARSLKVLEIDKKGRLDLFESAREIKKKIRKSSSEK